MLAPSLAARLLLGLSLLLLVQDGIGAGTQVLRCRDGANATLEDVRVREGKEMKMWSCAMTTVSEQTGRVKDFDLCPASCTTYCEKPIESGGPDPQDCQELSSYYAGSGRFTIEPRQYTVWEYGTCRVTQYNRLKSTNQKISYCFDKHHWAGVVDHLSSHCGAEQGSRGGSCYFYHSLHVSTITLERVV